MAKDIYRDPDLQWLDHIPPVGLVVASTLLKDLGLSPLHQTPIDTGLVAELVGSDTSKPAISDPWPFMEQVLGWEARHVAGAPGGPAIPENLSVHLPEHDTTLRPTWAVAELEKGDCPWQLLVRIEVSGVDPDARNALDGWEATPHQRFERLLRDTGVFAGVLISERTKSMDGTTLYMPEFRLIYAPRGETSGYQSFPIHPMTTVAGRPMLGGLKLLLDRYRLFSDSDDRRLPALLKRSRDAQALVSSALAEQVLGALHELLRGLDSADPPFIRDLAANHSEHLYEGLLTVLMRLVFVLYAEDRDLLPSRPDARAREIYETSYSVRGLYAKLTEDAALNPDTMDERRGGWGGLLALFRLIHKGHPTGFVQARGGKLFDPDEFRFLEGRAAQDDPARILNVSDGCLLRILEGLMTLKLRGTDRERLSYRTLDVEQIGSVYETVMGFTVEAAKSRVLAIKAGKNNKTPVFVALDELLAKKGKERIKDLKESVGRSLTASQAKPIEGAKTIDDLAAALDSVVDERGSPQKSIAPSGTPILQPTGERRRTGSHYTPRSLTAPIVKYALEPAFARLGPDANPEQILDLKVCDPAMGSGAFLVEACRAIGERLVAAWVRWPDTRPTIPADEDEELHARRLVAQRCLYGVDKNPRAVDLARLSLWLATLAKDHEFTFLDHALKCGDSLVGLTREQITSLHWDTNAGLPLFGDLVRERFEAAIIGRHEIREAPDSVERATQELRFNRVETQLENVRLVGNAIVGAFFSADKPRAREKKRQEIESWANGVTAEMWPKLKQLAETLVPGQHPVVPFHWEIEFPEVFARENSGFDGIVGNPPFAGKNTIISGHAKSYLPWLQVLHEGAHGNSDLVAHFFRRAFNLLCKGGVFGLIATNTIGQGDTRASGLTKILAVGGAILRATRRLKWPGEAAVIVSVVHVVKGYASQPILDTRPANRISAYLVEGILDESAARLAENSRRVLIGSYALGAGFLFDDREAQNGQCEPLAKMDSLILHSVHNKEKIRPFIGGNDLTTDPQQNSSRFIIDFRDLPLCRSLTLPTWEGMPADQRLLCVRQGIVPSDYPNDVCSDWPDLLAIVESFVRPERELQGDKSAKRKWWKYKRPNMRLYECIKEIDFVVARSLTSAHFPTFARVRTDQIFDQTVLVFLGSPHTVLTILCSRVHEAWVNFFSGTLEDRGRYNIEDCFETFPFPHSIGSPSSLEDTGAVYDSFRAGIMNDRNEGLTKIYNRFHARGENAPDITQLRALHAEMDNAILRAYGWDDLAERASAQFIEQDADEGKTLKTRLDWPAEFKDDVLARLLALNAERAAAERAAGLILPPDEDDPDAESEENGENGGGQ